MGGRAVERGVSCVASQAAATSYVPSRPASVLTPARTVSTRKTYEVNSEGKLHTSCAPTTPSRRLHPSMNIWTAAAEGDLARVQALVESGPPPPSPFHLPSNPILAGLSPSIADENTYTPLHASASWSHPSIFSYLVSKGGDPNVTDEDGETPLFVVETAEMARVVISLGGQVGWKNGEGLTVSPAPSFDLAQELSLPELSSRARTTRWDERMEADGLDGG